MRPSPQRAEPEVAPPRAILFDWDNTLVDNWGSIHSAMNATFEAMGRRPWTMAETRKRARRSLRDTFPEMFGERWLEARRLFYERMEVIHLQTLKRLPGAELLLRDLAGSAIWVAVVSNKTGKYLRREVAHLGWDEFFSRVVGAMDASADKPASAPVDLALEGSGLTKGGNVWFVGDAAVDLECAHNSGCVAVLVNDPTDGESEEFRLRSPDHRFAGCEDLHALVRRWAPPHV